MDMMIVQRLSGAAFAAILSVAVPALAATPAERPPLTADQTAQLRCVGVFAIVASEQARGVDDWAGYPPMAEDGATFSEAVTGAIMKDSGRTREEVRAEILKMIEDLQKGAIDSDDPATFARSAVDACMPLLRAAVPAKPKPTLQQCAVYVALAYQEVRSREGASKTAKDLATIASVLDHRARQQLKGEGKSESEADEIMGREKERIVAEAQAVEEAGRSSGIDFPHCFELAAP